MFTKDAMLSCRDCGESFTFSVDEQSEFASVGRLHPPSRCPVCRTARKARQAQLGGVRASPGFRERREQPQTKTTCAACGNPATVPFALRSDRVAYCSPCFEQRRASSQSEARG